MTMSVRFEIFPEDLDRTADFYTDVLRFTIAVDRRGAVPPYLALERDGVRIGAVASAHAADPAHRRPPTGVEIVLEVDDLEAEASWVRGRWPLNSDPALQAWGLRDFRLLDPSGYYLRVTER